ncbi:MAG TPA: GerMN domain-containing protein [Terriglobales bacterium]|nr:GerMN domain-containing protein [Terriglobales bacterium]
MIPRQLMIAVTALGIMASGMSLYVWRMRGTVAQTAAITPNTQPVAPPAAGPTEQVTLYVAYDEGGMLRARPARIPLPNGRQERAEELLRALVGIYLGKSSPHVLGAGSEIRGVYLADPGLAVIDLNAAFANGHRSGVLVEELTLASLLATLSANIPAIARVKILVDGKERDSLAGHVDLTAFYDVSRVNQLVTQLTMEP